jgi:hypothetical protein
LTDFLKLGGVILTIFLLVMVSGCTTDEELAEQARIDAAKNAPVITMTPTPEPINLSANITMNMTETNLTAINGTALNATINITTTVPIPTPTPIPTPIDIRVNKSGEEINWCQIKKECDTNIRSYKSELCISVHEMPNTSIAVYCGYAPIFTSSETKPPRIINDTYANGTYVNGTDIINTT